jgi:hypothetical protein
MHFDFTGAEIFQDYLAGLASAEQVLDHPAYRRVSSHARFFADGITSQDVELARKGKPSPFFGLQKLPSRIEAIQHLLEVLHREAETWLEDARTALAELFPHEDLDIPVYPIIGYDMGIGLDGAVCLNCNHAPYLEHPGEFLFFIIHECVHVIYERRHHILPLREVTSPAGWRSYFNLWLQNEGYAVYAPLGLRQRDSCLGDRDYQVLMDPEQLEAHRLDFLQVQDALQDDTPFPREQYLETCFGSQRLTYRMGCELVRRIEQAYGMERVRQAFYLTGDSFVEEYGSLLRITDEDRRPQRADDPCGDDMRR